MRCDEVPAPRDRAPPHWSWEHPRGRGDSRRAGEQLDPRPRLDPDDPGVKIWSSCPGSFECPSLCLSPVLQGMLVGDVSEIPPRSTVLNLNYMTLRPVSIAPSMPLH